jgi:hypothetical protein
VKLKILNHLIGSRTRDPSVCSIAPQLTMLPCSTPPPPKIGSKNMENYTSGCSTGSPQVLRVSAYLNRVSPYFTASRMLMQSWGRIVAVCRYIRRAWRSWVRNIPTEVRPPEHRVVGESLARCTSVVEQTVQVEECRLLGYKNPVRTSQETHYVSATEPSRLMLCKI